MHIAVTNALCVPLFLFHTGREEEVMTVHPRAVFIPLEGWTFLAAGTVGKHVFDRMLSINGHSFT